MSKLAESEASQRSKKKNHLMKSSWNLGKTATMRVPVVLKSQLMDIARHIDEGGKIQLVNSNNSEVAKETRNILSQDNLLESIAILERGIASKKQGGIYNSSNASPLKKEVIKALSILKGEISNV